MGDGWMVETLIILVESSTIYKSKGLARNGRAWLG